MISHLSLGINVRDSDRMVILAPEVGVMSERNKRALHETQKGRSDKEQWGADTTHVAQWRPLPRPPPLQVPNDLPSNWT